ncbi:MAG: hypothetical protein PF517_16255 [Salinivirgaceae bacterium]|nr:hypothetical protein [Salinivirgaceae bacterium]
MNFLYNDASTQKKRQFEEEIKNNSELKNELELQKEIDKAISNEIKVDSFRDRLNNIHDSHINKREGRILNLQNKWYWAAASITIFSGTAIYSIKNHFQSTDKLYQNYYEKWEPSFVTRGAESEALYKNIADEFEAGNYEKVK